MSTGGGEEEKARFLAQLDEMDIDDIIYSPENLSLTFAVDRPFSQGFKDAQLTWFQCDMKTRSNMKIEVLQGIDLDGLKHYGHFHLKAVTHDDGQQCVIGKSSFGRFASCKLLQDVGTKDVTIKTWDALFPLMRKAPMLHPKRLSNEIRLLTSEFLKSNPYVPKLIGYSVDKQLAVLYDLKARTTLMDALVPGGRPKLDWDSRCKVAIQLAHLLEILHSRNITIGSIDPRNILLDEENNIKLCEFGLCAGMQDVKSNEMWGTVKYLALTPELGNLEGIWGLGIKSDIFAFGCLLVELLTEDHVKHGSSSLSCWATKLLIHGEGNPANKSLITNEDMRSGFFELVMACLNNDPRQRWDAVTIGMKLKALTGAQMGDMNKRQKLETSSDLKACLAS